LQQRLPVTPQYVFDLGGEPSGHILVIERTHPIHGHVMVKVPDTVGSKAGERICSALSRTGP